MFIGLSCVHRLIPTLLHVSATVVLANTLDMDDMGGTMAARRGLSACDLEPQRKEHPSLLAEIGFSRRADVRSRLCRAPQTLGHSEVFPHIAFAMPGGDCEK